MLYLAAAYTDLTVRILKMWLQSRLQARGPLVLWITSLTSLRIQTTTKQKWGDTECVWKVWMPSRLIKVQSSDRTCFYTCYFISTYFFHGLMRSQQSSITKKKPQLHQQIWKIFQRQIGRAHPEILHTQTSTEQFFCAWGCSISARFILPCVHISESRDGEFQITLLLCQCLHWNPQGRPLYFVPLCSEEPAASFSCTWRPLFYFILFIFFAGANLIPSTQRAPHYVRPYYFH